MVRPECQPYFLACWELSGGGVFCHKLADGRLHPQRLLRYHCARDKVFHSQKLGHPAVNRRRVHLLRRTLLQDAPLVQNGQPVTEENGFLLVVRHIDHRDARLVQQLTQFRL
jgi:hypothetical protein